MQIFFDLKNSQNKQNIKNKFSIKSEKIKKIKYWLQFELKSEKINDKNIP